MFIKKKLIEYKLEFEYQATNIDRLLNKDWVQLQYSYGTAIVQLRHSYSTATVQLWT